MSKPNTEPTLKIPLIATGILSFLLISCDAQPPKTSATPSTPPNTTEPTKQAAETPAAAKDVVWQSQALKVQMTYDETHWERKHPDTISNDQTAFLATGGKGRIANGKGAMLLVTAFREGTPPFGEADIRKMESSPAAKHDWEVKDLSPGGVSQVTITRRSDGALVQIIRIQRLNGRTFSVHLQCDVNNPPSPEILASGRRALASFKSL